MEKRKNGFSSFATLKRLLSYFRGVRLFLLILVVFLVVWTSLANILSTFFSKNVLGYLENGMADLPTTEERLLGLGKEILPLLIITMTGVACNLLYTQIMVHLTQDILYRIRRDLFQKMQVLPISYFDTHTHGEIMTYFTNDVDTIVTAMNDSFANILLSLSNIIGTLTCMGLLCTPLFLSVLPLILFLFFFLFFNTRSTRKYFKRQQDALAEVNSKVEEDISGVKVEKAFNHEEASLIDFEKSNRKWRENSEKAFFHTQLATPVNVSVSYFNFALAAVLGSYFLVQGKISFGSLAVFLVFTRSVCQPFNFFTIHANAILTCLAGSQRIFSFLDEKEEEDKGEVTLARTEETNKDLSSFTSRYEWEKKKEDGSIERIPLIGKIEFKDVSFSYRKGHEILHHVSFTATPGKKVAFVGSTGAGKTTIISLLARFYKIDSGEILYDGIPVEEIKLDSLRRALSMIPQESHLFTGSIEDNLRYVRRHSTSKEVEEASKMSHADSFIRRTPNGYNTMLYDDGRNLSEGQRQLLSITRASLNQPPVMILDEATSNIDTHSEELIQTGLRNLMKNKTVIEIAHRLSTIRDADEIIVLDHGTMIERGRQEELLARKGAYYDLYTGKKELA